MDNEEIILDDQEVLETSESEEQAQTDQEETPTLSPEEIKELKEKAAKAEDLEKKNKQLYARVKKDTPTKVELTPKDALLLAKKDVHEDDLDTIMEWASFKKVSVSEALEDTTLQNVLNTRSQERRTALAANTGGARGTTKQTGAQLLDRAETTGEVPDTTEGMNALFMERLKRKLKKN